MMLTSHDRAIAELAYLEFNLISTDILSTIGSGIGWGNDPGNGFGIYDNRVRFQFPLKILSDNRSGTWIESGIPGNEPVPVFKSSGPRIMSLSWTYIVESILPSDPSTPWTLRYIKEQVNLVRGYFARCKEKLFRENLIVYFKYPLLTGPEIWTCRITAVDVKHSDNLIWSTGASGPSEVFPLQTDIVVDLRLFVQETGRTNDPVIGIDVKRNPSPIDLWY